ncbi:MAG: caspase family protein [Haliscomenobacter sp.]|uniref:caspase family protein n=1 Tax=Haliscomenobacter sp. TaxID=2717303 RepID=UPI0029A2F145|nr:caspase family protein [Haliscomenobacter sp.]MDX2072561.1 caspase family protein [Haliscomenobacter sp.]
MQKRLFALLVGINQYAAKGFRTLQGAEADALHMMNYLKNLSADFDVQPISLLGSNATRANIISGIREHLSQAKSEDVVLFFFSGHGIKEEAPEVFQKYAGSKSLESLACYDSYAKTGLYGLANKEIRYLLHQSIRHDSHVAIITDCCHSARMTRGGLEPLRRMGTPKEGKDMADARDWQAFEFGNHINENQIRQAKSLNNILPEVKHVHLAACQAEESAFEVGKMGIFTAHLLDALDQSNGEISYHQLNEYIHALIRSRVKSFTQRPDIYQTPRSRLVDAPFLLASGRKRKIYASVAIGEKDVRISRGLIHGIPAQKEFWKDIHINIFDTSQAEQQPVASGVIVGADLSTSKILFYPPEFVPRKDRFYEGQIEGLYLRNFNVAMWGAAEDEKGKELLRTAYRDAFQRVIDEEPSATTDCVVVVHDNQMVLAHPDSDYSGFEWSKFMPLAEQQYVFNANTAEKVVGQLKWIAQWNFVRNIQSYGTLIRENHFDFTIKMDYGKGAPREVIAEDNCYRIPVERTWDERGVADEEGVNLSFSIKNNSNITLHFGLVYLSQLFGIYPNMLVDPDRLDNKKEHNSMSIAINTQQIFESGESVFFQVEKFIKDYHQIGEDGIFRLFVASEAFNLKDLAQSPLAPAKKDKPKGDDNEKEEIKLIQLAIGQVDWAVFDYPVQLTNPDYK